MKPTLAATSFQTGPDEKLAAADVYAAPPQSPVGAISDTVGSITSLLGLEGALGELGALGGLLTGDLSVALSTELGKVLGNEIGGLVSGDLGPLLKGDISGVLNGDLGKALGGKFTNLEAGIKTVSGLLNGDKALLNTLGKGMVGDLLTSAGFGDAGMAIAGSLLSGGDPSSLLEGIAKNNPQLKFITDGVETIAKVKDIGSVEELLSVATKISGMEEVGKLLQIGPQLGMIKTLVDRANASGIPQLASAIIGRVDNASDKKALEIATALGAARGTNIEMLTATVGKYGNDGILGTHPTIVKVLLSNYRFIEEGTVPTQVLATELIELCNSLDVNWLYVNRGGLVVPNLDCMIGISPDARELFYIDDVMRPIALTASGYSSTSLISLAQRQYPMTPLKLEA